MNVDEVKRLLQNLSIYELFAVIELSRREICHRHIKEYDSCMNCPLTSLICREFYQRALFIAKQEENE